MVSTAAWLFGAIACAEPVATEPTSSLDCQKGYYEVDGACVLRPDVVTIVIRQPTGVTGSTTCPAYSPNPASVKVNQGFRFTNETQTTYTIELSSYPVVAGGSTPLTTVTPGTASVVFSISSAGTRLFDSATCKTAGRTPGTLHVTSG